MHRRSFLSLVGVTCVAGCTGDGDGSSGKSTDTVTSSSSTPTGTPEESPTDPEDEPTTVAETASGPNFDAVVDYTVHIQDSADGEYDLPEPRNEGWGWLVLEISVAGGELEMADIWFNAFFETKERLLAVAHESEKVEDGVMSSGSIRADSQGVVLHDYPPSPRSEPVGWNVSPMDQTVGGDGVIADGPTELYPSVSLEYSVETAKNPDVLPDEYANRRNENEIWAVVTLSVADGHLNMEDVWFRSRLVTGSRTHDLAHASETATRGVRSRGMVKSGNQATALYLIGADETIEGWGYTEDRRQDGPIAQL